MADFQEILESERENTQAKNLLDEPRSLNNEKKFRKRSTMMLDNIQGDFLDKAKDDHLAHHEKPTITNLNELLSNLKNLQKSKAIRTLKLLEETFDE